MAENNKHSYLKGIYLGGCIQDVSFDHRIYTALIQLILMEREEQIGHPNGESKKVGVNCAS